MEYQALKGVANPVPGTFWGKDFLLVDVDNSGPVSIDIPPGTYTGTELAAAVQTALRDAFGDDKKVQLTANVDNEITIDLKAPAGDGKAKGLTTPIVVDFHASSVVATASEAQAGLELNDFLVHAQRLITDAMNKKIQSSSDDGDDNAANANELKVSGRMFKKVAGSTINTSTPIPEGTDIIKVTHTIHKLTLGLVQHATYIIRMNKYTRNKAYDQT
jgi:hypothetical protein